jgi:5-methylcytosine-specific restriction endonuclease McrA
VFKKSNNPKVEELTKSVKERSYNLSCLQAIKLEELNAKGKPKRLCAWCCENELFHGNQKYCSQNCSDNGMAWAYPQKENSLKFLLMRQDYKCNHCQYDYRPLLEEIANRSGSKFNVDDLGWGYFKRLKLNCPFDRIPEVDHIIPIYKGGESLGNSNHQCICYTCHKIKSKIDNSGPRKKA